MYIMEKNKEDDYKVVNSTIEFINKIDYEAIEEIKKKKIQSIKEKKIIKK